MMSAFEVTVTPTRLKNKKRQESREPTDVIMAPFSSKAIVQFEDVPVTKTAKRLLKIVNPSEDDIEVKVTKSVNAEHNLTIEWTENVVPAHTAIDMEMVWSPLIDVACKETLQLTDNRNFRKDVMIILKSVANKPAKNTRKFPTISSSGTHVKTLRLKSPTGSTKATKSALQSQQRKRIISQAEKPTQKTEKPKVVEKGSTTQWKDTLRAVPRAQHRDVQVHVSPLAERNIIEINGCGNNDVSPVVTKFDNHKENVSPLTPSNVLNLIDNMKFTPATENHNRAIDKIENLASWPTPVNPDYSLLDENKLVRDIRPRRLTAAELTESDEVDKQHIPEILVEEFNETRGTAAIVTNKTFEVKRTESLESLDGSLVEGRLSCGVVMNKTTTITATPIARPLEMIQEEDGFSSPPSNEVKTMSKMNDKPSTLVDTKESEILKRDIKLIGTPLRKYSESMKDLSLKSPQTKIPIQGSMPNLNEMENIRSIEQNRYFYQTTTQIKENISVIHEVNQKPSKQITTANSLDDSTDNSNTSQMSLVSHADMLFNQSEILAQSSRFNLNEIGCKSRKNSPVSSKFKTYSKATLRQTPPNSTKKPSPSATDAGGQKRRSRELSFSDSLSTESIGSNTSSTKTSNKSGFMVVSPPKRLRIDGDTSFQRPAPTNASSARVKNWSQTQPKKFKLAKTLSLVKKPITPRKTKDEPRVKLYDCDLYLQPFINPDPFAATTTCDPFLASTMYLDERAVDRHQNDFKKWLNALVSIPADLDADSNTQIDVGKLFNEVRNKDLMLAPTKEEQSMNYLTKFRLESLRRAAVQLFLSEEMRLPCSKVAVYVNKNAIRIRSDRNLHLDVVMQRYILELLLCFNPLWLRLGLEVVYGEKIHLHSNRDIVGLSTFILNRLFRDKFLEQKYSKAYTLSDEYADHIKKFTLQKMLFLLLFLDKAKSQHIVKHNPCLFVKKSPYKETKEILLKFSSELLANIGDITRELKRLGYVLQHKQTFLDEFNYAFNNLAVDLRDGIRLTKVMEIILLREDLSKQLRVPAISRLQRIFNVNLGLRALSEADFQLKGDITAADIVDGHREKTLSLLWQIIYKFRSPKFHAAARVLQLWWRKSWLRVVVQRRIRLKEEQRRENAATKIQAVYRGYITRQFAKVYKNERVRAATIIQKYARRYLAQKHFYHCVRSVIQLQRWYRSQIKTRECRQHFLTLRNNTVFLQRCLRRWIFAKKLVQAATVIETIQTEARLLHSKALVIQRFFRSIVIHRKLQDVVKQVVSIQRRSNLEFVSAARIQSFLKSVRLRRELQEKRNAIQCIQTYWRSYKKTCIVRKEYLKQRECAIIIQRKFRAHLVMQKQRNDFVLLRSAATTLQRRFRAQKLMAEERSNYLHLKTIAIKIQQRRRALLEMRKQRVAFVQQREVIINLQRRVRATQAMKAQRQSYLKLKEAATTLQRFYRARLEMKKQLKSYTHIRQCVIRIQLKWRATLLARRVRFNFISMQYFTSILQQKYRATKLMRSERADFLQLKESTILIQRRFRGKLQMRRERESFLRKQQAVVTIQRKFRAHKLMRFNRAKYKGTRTAAICIQQYVRGYLQMKRDREDFHRKKRATVELQRAFRARQSMLKSLTDYQRLREAAICLQRRFRARQSMQQEQTKYQHQRNLIISLQRRFRAKLLARTVRKEYASQRNLIIGLQRRYRATRLMRETQNAFREDRSKVIKIQSFFRSYLAMKQQRSEYQKQRQAAICLQTWYRSILHQRKEQQSYQRIRCNSLTIQRKWRATLAMRQQRQLYLHTVQKIVIMQRVIRATVQMRKERQFYQQQKAAAIVLQRRYRARLEMLKMRSQYLLIRSLIICIQRKYRAQRSMIADRRDFLILKRTTIHLQQKYRGRIQMQTERENFVRLQRSTLSFQAQARGFLARSRFQALMTPEMMEFLRQKKAAKIIQRYWRGYRVRKRWRNIRILQIRKNIQMLKETSNAVNSIRWKVKDAVRILRGRFSASEALHVLTRLERLSRTVPHLLMSHSDFICTFCYGIMAQAIRSEVDKQLIEYCSRIILNLARYNSTTANTFQEGGLVTIAQMLLRWCDKDCEIFNTLCTLIWIFSHCAHKRQVIRDFMTTPEAIYVVRETKKLVARKEKMKQNVRKPMVASTRGQQQATFSSRALPSLEPDYGVIRNKPYTFISSVYAFDTILYKLGIDIF